MMRDARGKTYRPWPPEFYRQEAYSPGAKLPQDDLVFFVLDAVAPLDVRRFYAPYEEETRGAPPFDPKMIGCLLLYAYCVGGLSSRTIAQACERNLGFWAMVGEDRPDFRPISEVRKLHREAFWAILVQGLCIAAASGLVKLGQVWTDGPTLQGHASRHTAMSYGDMKKDVERLREEIEAVLTQASQQDAEDEAALGSRRGDEWPAEWARREDRWAAIEAAMQRLEARAKAKAERQRRAEAAAKRQRTGQKRRGRTPKEVDETPDDKAQRSCSEPALPIMQTNTKGGEYCGNAQASVAGAQWTVGNLDQAGMERAKDAAGRLEKIPGTYDRGYDSEAAAEAVEPLGCDPYMATGGQRHPAPEAQVSEAPQTATERLAAKVRPAAGRALYARRQGNVEPGLGQIKEARGFRWFLLRGLANIRAEWSLVCWTHNLLKMWRDTGAPSTV